MIGIIDYNAGNLQSVCNAVEKLNIPFVVAKNPDALKNVEKIIFPGVGHAKSCMQEVKNRGFDVFLQTTKKPVLGICVGMQLFFDFSEEGDTACLGIVSGVVQRFDPQKVNIIPHMGWNAVSFSPKSIFHHIPSGADFYFVHSYFCNPKNSENSIAQCQYDDFSFCAAVQKDNFIGVQFHPEKSGALGAALLHNFIGK